TRNGDNSIESTSPQTPSPGSSCASKPPPCRRYRTLSHGLPMSEQSAAPVRYSPLLQNRAASMGYGPDRGTYIRSHRTSSAALRDKTPCPGERALPPDILAAAPIPPRG